MQQLTIEVVRGDIDVFYQSHISGAGWLPVVRNGTPPQTWAALKRLSFGSFQSNKSVLTLFSVLNWTPSGIASLAWSMLAFVSTNWVPARDSEFEVDKCCLDLSVSSVRIKGVPGFPELTIGGS